MSTLKYALELAKHGFHVFPVIPNGKAPAKNNWQNMATTDPEKIKDMWKINTYNIGIATEFYGKNGESLVVIDVDVKDKVSVEEKLKRVFPNDQAIPKTYTQYTPSGGRHLVFKSPRPVKSSVSELTQGIDVRSKGALVVAAGSIIDGTPYKADGQIGFVVEDAPNWLIEKCGAPNPKREVLVDNIVEEKSALDRAIHYLQNEAPVAVQGAGGDVTTFKVAAHCKDLGLDDKATLDVMLSAWNDRCEPPWDLEDLEIKIKNAFRHGQNEPGVMAPEKQFEPLPVDTTRKHWLDRMNEEYALLFSGGAHSIMQFTKDEFDEDKIIYHTEAAFKRKFSNQLVQLDGNSRPKSQAELWLESDKRRDYIGVVFDPKSEVGGEYYNLWQGFTCKQTPYDKATKQAQRGFEMFKEHLEKNICTNVPERIEWVTSFLAHLIQKPWEKPLCALVLKGRKGTGKNALFDRVGSILGKNCHATVTNQRHLLGNFNAHLQNKLLFVLDEAFWSGDKKAEGILKQVVTDTETFIEPKGRDAYKAKNLMRVCIVGNEDWLVPATSDERRFTVLEVGEDNIQDGQFFREMRILMDQRGGREVLLDYLMNYKLTRDPNVFLNTKELMDQKNITLSPFEMFWKECLESGTVGHYGWPERISKKDFMRAFAAYKKEMGMAYYTNTTRVSKDLMRLCTSVDARQKTLGKERHPAYKLPDLDVAQKEWINQMGDDGTFFND